MNGLGQRERALSHRLLLAWARRFESNPKREAGRTTRARARDGGWMEAGHDEAEKALDQN